MLLAGGLDTVPFNHTDGRSAAPGSAQWMKYGKIEKHFTMKNINCKTKYY